MSKCLVCGEDISGTLRDKKFCSDSCRTKYHNEKRKTLKTCLNCGKPTTTKYCSKECGTEYRNKRRKKC